MKYKGTYEGNKSFRPIVIILLSKTLSGEIVAGQNYSSEEIFVTNIARNDFLLPAEFLPPPQLWVTPKLFSSLNTPVIGKKSYPLVTRRTGNFGASLFALFCEENKILDRLCTIWYQKKL